DNEPNVIRFVISYLILNSLAYCYSILAQRFRESTAWVMKLLWKLEGASQGRIPALVKDVASIAQMVKLPPRRERAFPRIVKERPQKYATARRKNGSQA
ncbi:putative transposase (partial), partial [Pectobacterium atrosepticum SCRI1043]